MEGESITQKPIENLEARFLASALKNFSEAVEREEYIKYASGNPYAEVDVAHFNDMAVQVSALWQRTERSKVPVALTIAVLYHDFDRVFPSEATTDPNIKTTRRAVDIKVAKDSEYGTAEVDPVKFIVHPRNCAAIFRDYNKDLPRNLLNDISFLIERHESGAEKDAEGNPIVKPDTYSGKYDLNKAAEILCEADGISFFTTIIYSYAKGRSVERIKKKIAMSYRKLKKEARSIVREADYMTITNGDNIIDLKKLVEEVTKQVDLE